MIYLGEFGSQPGAFVKGGIAQVGHVNPRAILREVHLRLQPQGRHPNTSSPDSETVVSSVAAVCFRVQQTSTDFTAVAIST